MAELQEGFLDKLKTAIKTSTAGAKARAAGKQNPTIAGKYAPQTGMQGPPAMGDGGGAPSNVEQGGGI